MENPEFYQGPAGYYTNAQFTPEKRHSDTKSAAGDHFIVEDLLDFPNDDAVVFEGKYDPVTGTSADSSAVTAVDSCNSSFSGGEPHFTGDIGCRSFADAQFSNDLCVPYDDLAELEWLSNIVEESFSSEDLQKLQLISGMTSGRAAEGSSETTREFNPDATTHNNSIFHPEVSVPGKARSKRSRAAPCNWASRLLALSPTSSESGEMGHNSSGTGSSSNNNKTVLLKPKKKEGGENLSHGPDSAGDGRKCLHCATDKTPQWRTGPMGPKTLCNACGVRYKSGRLVPEYRPAASPTFVLTKHSNSHRKVMELRRQKEVYRAHQLQPGQFLHQDHRIDFEGLDGTEDYLIHQHIGPDYRQLI
ncbi:hypothetical protein C3L33_08941, partial [Rhododendron williamsianum]